MLSWRQWLFFYSLDCWVTQVFYTGSRVENYTGLRSIALCSSNSFRVDVKWKQNHVLLAPVVNRSLERLQVWVWSVKTFEVSSLSSWKLFHWWVDYTICLGFCILPRIFNFYLRNSQSYNHVSWPGFGIWSDMFSPLDLVQISFFINLLTVSKRHCGCHWNLCKNVRRAWTHHAWFCTAVIVCRWFLVFPLEPPVSMVLPPLCSARVFVCIHLQSLHQLFHFALLFTEQKSALCPPTGTGERNINDLGMIRVGGSNPVQQCSWKEHKLRLLHVQIQFETFLSTN